MTAMMTPAQQAVIDRNREQAAARQRQIEEDVLWLYSGGVHPEWWPDRVGVPSLSALEKRMRKYPEIRARISSAMFFLEACKK